MTSSRLRLIGLLLASLTVSRAGELHDAAQACDLDRLRGLLAREPSLNETDDRGRTPLHTAVESQQPACVGLLIKAGADPSIQDGDGKTAFDAAKEIPDPQAQNAIRIYLSMARPAQTAFAVPWSLEHSVTHGQTDLTRMLLSFGADPNTIGARGASPLSDAALKGDLDTVRLLLEAGARVDIVSRDGMQPIHHAALGNNPVVIRELLARGAKVNARTRDEQQTPLHFAAAMAKMEAVEALIALGADLTAEDSQGRNPLEVAERSGRSEAAAALRRAALTASNDGSA